LNGVCKPIAYYSLNRCRNIIACLTVEKNPPPPPSIDPEIMLFSQINRK